MPDPQAAWAFLEHSALVASAEQVEVAIAQRAAALAHARSLGLADLRPRMDLTLIIHRPDGTTDKVPVRCRVDTLDEVAYYRHGGILPYVLRGMAQAA